MHDVLEIGRTSEAFVSILLRKWCRSEADTGTSAFLKRSLVDMTTAFPMFQDVK